MITQAHPGRRQAATERPRVRKILTLLARQYPEPRCALRFSDPLELLVATILSAQCTDVRVNQVTKELFVKYRTAGDYATAPPGQLEADIRSTGFYRNKARAIRACCAALEKQHGGRVPRTMEDLVELPGVGRKTANLVLAEAFDIPGIVVDTHVSRLSQRLGLTSKTDPEKIEQDLVRIIPKDQWNGFSLRLILHGRAVCKARKPDCDACPLVPCCPTGLSRV
ncbi:MAG TPA: endonuclease III [Candidatus Polarisedimenticolia bacterium]|jgi:endonuclease-3